MSNNKESTIERVAGNDLDHELVRLVLDRLMPGDLVRPGVRVIDTRVFSRFSKSSDRRRNA